MAAAGLIFAATSALAANVASGTSPAGPSSIPDSAFQPVTVPAPASTPDLGPIFDAWPSTAREARPQPSLPESEPIVVVRPTPKPKAPTGGSLSGEASGGRSISGVASWYCRAGWSICTVGYPDTTGFDAYAAAGPRLRAALGDGWRGRVVTVDGIRVKLIDWCQCYKGEPHEKLLDLYYDVFARVGSKVTVRW